MTAPTVTCRVCKETITNGSGWRHAPDSPMAARRPHIAEPTPTSLRAYREWVRAGRLGSENP